MPVPKILLMKSRKNRNLIVDSSNMMSNKWQVFGGAIRTQTADGLELTDGAAYSALAQNFANLPMGSYRLSLEVKAGTQIAVNFHMQEVNSPYTYLGGGAVPNATTDWRRVTTTINVSIASLIRVQIYVGAPATASEGTILIRNVQLEAGSSATEYQST
jgi:hypothetical protein